MAYAEVDRLNCQIKLIYPTNESVKGLEKWQEEINNYPVVIIPQNTITDQQMKLLYVLFKQYGEELGYTMIEMKELLKEEFGFEQEIGEFSLSPYKKNPMTLELATEFIQFIVEHAIDNNISLYIMDKKTRVKRHVREIVPDIQRYVIACLRARMCCVTGLVHDFENDKIVDLHHVDSANATYGGYEYDTGLEARVMPLCREKHNEFHSIGEKAFCEKYHVEGVYLNEKLVAELKEIYKGHFKGIRRADGQKK